MTDPLTPGTPDNAGENTPTPDPSYPAAPQAPDFGTPAPPPPAPSTFDAPAAPPGPPAPPAPGVFPASGTYDAPAAPPSAYPAPGQGGFPPPPAGGFPPPPQQAAPYAQGYVAPPDVGQAFSWGWAKFKDNAGALIVSHLLWGLALVIVGGVGFAMLTAGAAASSSSQSDLTAAAGGSLSLGGIVVLSIAVTLIALFASIACTNGYLVIADGRKASIGDFFVFRNIGQGILLSLLTAVAAGLLSFTGIGSLAVGFFTAYAMFFVIDRGFSAIDAIKASVDLALKNAGQTILLVLLVSVAASVGLAVCGIGALVTVPLGYLAVTYLYRRFSGGQVAA